MKKLLAILSIFGSFSASAAVYQCTCYDTGYECDGYQQLSLNLHQNQATVAFGENLKAKSITATLKGQLDPNYNPRVNKGFVRYFTGNQTFPQVLVNSALTSTHPRAGIVKISEYGKDGSYGHTWEFSCAIPTL